MDGVDAFLSLFRIAMGSDKKGGRSAQLGGTPPPPSLATQTHLQRLQHPPHIPHLQRFLLYALLPKLLPYNPSAPLAQLPPLLGVCSWGELTLQMCAIEEEQFSWGEGGAIFVDCGEGELVVRVLSRGERRGGTSEGVSSCSSRRARDRE